MLEDNEDSDDGDDNDDDAVALQSTIYFHWSCVQVVMEMINNLCLWNMARFSPKRK